MSYSSASEPKPRYIGPEAHTDHPLRHFDRTCPACNADAARNVLYNAVAVVSDTPRTDAVCDSDRPYNEERLVDLSRELERELAVHRQDCPTFRDFYARYAIGPKYTPSCLVCGWDVPQDKVGILHTELPAIVVCVACRDAGQRMRTPGYNGCNPDAP
jgi:hypothetical protein